VAGHVQRRRESVAVSPRALVSAGRGITIDLLSMTTAFLRLRDHAMHDLGIRSNFMHWLNQKTTRQPVRRL